MPGFLLTHSVASRRIGEIPKNIRLRLRLLVNTSLDSLPHCALWKGRDSTVTAITSFPRRLSVPGLVIVMNTKNFLMRVDKVKGVNREHARSFPTFAIRYG